MKTNQCIYLLLLSVIILINSCKTNNQQKKKAVNIKDVGAVENRFFSIDYITNLANNILTDRIGEIYDSAGDSMKNEITRENFINYFSLIKKFYGKLQYVEDYGVVGNEKYVGIDLKAKFEKLDTCELQTVFYKHSRDSVDLLLVKVVPLKTQQCALIDSLCAPVIERLKSKDIDGLYQMMSDDFRFNNPLSFFKDELKKHIDQYEHLKDFKISEHDITVFDHDNVGAEVVYQFRGDDKNQKVLFIYHLKNEKLELSSIIFGTPAES